MSTTCRLIVDEPADGAWNMAVDDVLLTAAADEGVATLRFYMWVEPTLSLGYFQPLASRAEHAASADCPIVRRASGGGAIVHDRELTYSLAIRGDQLPHRDHAHLYALVHDTLIESLASLGVIGARRFGAAGPAVESAKVAAKQAAEHATGEPFLCFHRRSEFDVILAGEKIVGSAQRKRRSAVLQHGSVLLARSVAAPTLPGVRDVAGVEITVDQLFAAWQKRLAATLNLHLEPGELSAAERAASAETAANTFGAGAWLGRR